MRDSLSLSKLVSCCCDGICREEKKPFIEVFDLTRLLFLAKERNSI